MPRTSKTSIKGFFENIENRLRDKAEEELESMIPTLTFMMHQYALEEMKKLNKSSMTGNYINSFGIALYRDGRLIAIGTTNDEEGQDPIQPTLIKYDVFKRGRKRYSGYWQAKYFIAPGGTKSFLANEEVVDWLNRYPPSKKKGFAFRAVTVVEYADSVGGQKVLLRLADDIENSGGVINELMLQ